MPDSPQAEDTLADAESPAGPPPPRRGPGHRAADARDTAAEMAARAHEISLEAGSKMAGAMREVIGAAAGLSAFAIESARDLIHYMVRRGQMAQEEAEQLIAVAEGAYIAKHGSLPKPEPKAAPAKPVPLGSTAKDQAASAAARAPRVETPSNAPMPVRANAPSASHEIAPPKPALKVEPKVEPKVEAKIAEAKAPAAKPAAKPAAPAPVAAAPVAAKTAAAPAAKVAPAAKPAPTAKAAPAPAPVKVAAPVKTAAVKAPAPAAKAPAAKTASAAKTPAKPVAKAAPAPASKAATKVAPKPAAKAPVKAAPAKAPPKPAAKAPAKKVTAKKK